MVDLDFEKTPANQHVTVAIGPANAIADIYAPTAAELNAMQPASQSISWNDFDFGIQASETVNDPSLADVSNYQDFGAAAYGGSVSFYYPKDYDDASNEHSNVYDLTDKPWTDLIVAIRIDGETKTSVPFANGDRISVYTVKTDSETNSLQGADALRRTVGLLQRGSFSHYTIVGSHTISVTPASITGTSGDAGRLVATVGGRTYTNALRYRTSDPGVVRTYPGGVYELLAPGTADILIEDEGAGTTATVEVTVA